TRSVCAPLERSTSKSVYALGTEPSKGTRALPAAVVLTRAGRWPMAVSSAVSGRSVSGSDGSRRSMIPSARGPGRATTSESPPSVKSMPLGANGIGSVQLELERAAPFGPKRNSKPRGGGRSRNDQGVAITGRPHLPDKRPQLVVIAGHVHHPN